MQEQPQEAQRSLSSDGDRTSVSHPHHRLIKREPSHRIFANRSLLLSTIKYFGFDMDYTLAVYKSPEFETLTFNMSIERLISSGYPAALRQYSYDKNFAVRGLWYDTLYGNLLKVDLHGNILKCLHGFTILSGAEVRKYYPNKFFSYDESRIFNVNTFYELPECYVLSCIIDYMNKSEIFKKEDTGFVHDELFISFKAIHEDVRQAIEHLYISRTLQNELIRDFSKYIEKDDRLLLMLRRVRENNCKVFLLTNGDYEWTNALMSFLLNEHDMEGSWKSFFDYIIVDARKPLFFAEGTALKEINLETGIKNFGSHAGPLKPNRVYSGGSCDSFSKLIGAAGKDVLYVGDHIFGDIIKSKKQRAWRTFLIVPELAQELLIWHEKRDLFAEIQELEEKLSIMMINYDSASKDCPDISNIQAQLKSLVNAMELQYSKLGSSFRSGSTQTYFSSQITRYADIYAATYTNLLHYPFFYLFKAPPILMPHESTVDPNEPFSEDHSSNLIHRENSK